MTRIGLVAVVTACMLCVGPVVAQEEGSAPSPGEQGAVSGQEDQNIDVSQIDRILRGEERVLQGEIFFYDPAGRRDPFRSLKEGVQEAPGSVSRPPGLPGTMIEELRVEGVIETPDGIIAFAQNSRDNLSYTLKPGTKLYNGEVERILPDKIVFKQQVSDPKALKPYTEVVREIGQK